MEFVNKLETTVAGWVKNVPHLPVAGQKWLAQNVWWIALISALLSGIAVLVSLFGLLLGGVVAGFAYVLPGLVALLLVSAIIGLVFSVARVILLGMAIQPLRTLSKKGWVLLFMVWMLEAARIVVSAVLSLVTLSFFGFFTGIIFGALGLAIFGYFLFEIRGQFAHSTKAAAKKA